MNKSCYKAIYLAALGAMLCGLIGLPPFHITSGASSGVITSPPAATTQRNNLPQAEIVHVVESGDPDAPGETLAVNEVAIQNVLHESHALAAFPTAKRKYKNAQRVAEAMLGYALDYADRSPPVARATTPGQIRKIVGLFDYRSEDVPFCAMGIAFVASKAYCDIGPEKVTYGRTNDTKTFQKVLPLIKRHYFTPSPSCRIMLAEAKKKRYGQRGSWVAKGVRAPKRAWLVLFDWENKRGVRDGIPDHVGIVHRVGGHDAPTLHTVEFNTSIRTGSRSNGGAVAKKVRSMRDVLGFIRTY